MSSSDDEFTFNLQPYIDEAVAKVQYALEGHAEAEVVKILQDRGYKIEAPGNLTDADALTLNNITRDWLIERAFETIAVEEPLSSVSRADIRQWLELFERLGLARIPAIQPEVQWATYAIGVFGPRGQNATFYDTEDEAWAAAQRASYGGIAPGTRKRAVINGEEYFTEWKTLPKTEAEIKEWRAK